MCGTRYDVTHEVWRHVSNLMSTGKEGILNLRGLAELLAPFLYHAIITLAI